MSLLKIIFNENDHFTYHIKEYNNQTWPRYLDPKGGQGGHDSYRPIFPKGGSGGSIFYDAI